MMWNGIAWRSAAMRPPGQVCECRQHWQRSTRGCSLGGCLFSSLLFKGFQKENCSRKKVVIVVSILSKMTCVPRGLSSIGHVSYWLGSAYRSITSVWVVARANAQFSELFRTGCTGVDTRQWRQPWQGLAVFGRLARQIQKKYQLTWGIWPGSSGDRFKRGPNQ